MGGGLVLAAGAAETGGGCGNSHSRVELQTVVGLQWSSKHWTEVVRDRRAVLERRGVRLLEVVSQQLGIRWSRWRHLSSFCVFRGLCSDPLANDAKVVKTGSERQFNGLIIVYRKTLKSDGIAGLYRGFTVSCVGIIVYRRLYFGLNDSLKPVVFVGKMQDSFGEPGTNGQHSFYQLQVVYSRILFVTNLVRCYVSIEGVVIYGSACFFDMCLGRDDLSHNMLDNIHAH
ncbi:uncharacterized protein LOC120292592 [Eucalyptus grandis]|uniref:uncharacterized protein LOC120292592 n=1 Tax=Eucalyptus grandis TaxID=71139 RepID=UPI00192EF0EC|nr:uncharacterized protein LOC120292592 [Eucalyptus grandis]